MITLSEIIFAFKNGSQEERIEFIELIAESIDTHLTPNFTEKISGIVDYFMIYSERNYAKRIVAVEEVTGLVDYSDATEEEIERVPNLPEKIEILETKFEEIKVNPTIPVPEFKEPTTQAQKIGCFFRNTALKSKKGALNNTEMMNILKKNKLPEDCRPKEGLKNFRKLKKDALDAVKEMYNDVFISKLDKGRHETRLVINRNLS